MAEIKIQEKKRSNLLPLILGALALLLLLGYCFTRDRAPAGADTTATGVGNTNSTDSAAGAAGAAGTTGGAAGTTTPGTTTPGTTTPPPTP